VLGRTGRCIEEHFGLPPDTIDIKMGTLSKAIPSVGGYIAGSAKLCEFLSLQARGFIYSAALPAAAAAAALESIRILEEEPDRVARLQQNSSYFAAGLDRLGLSHLNSASAVFPIVCGEDWDAWRMARHCQKHGVFVQAVPHPVVPKGTARLRAAVSATHTREDLDRCLAVLESGADRFPAVRRLRSQL
jgi:7-keto-8-aminopelargonate synthetase-like enzyme